MFFRAGGLARLEDLREEKLTDWVVKLQGYSRGYLGRKNFQKLKVVFGFCKVIIWSLLDFDYQLSVFVIFEELIL